ncbi:hypothetical protein [Mesorhizobium silamurunense]|uniref:hypothetical protein n=1 Tax=Mesorhizobium silamurunense TaxID=499528 RepID=UPI00177CC9B7|nr:hypothetical protein [Mesorhizobium silamurunense]
MTQTGGPAAINGFLYQILHHLSWVSESTLIQTLGGENVIDACLVLEPIPGGDARAEGPDLFLVEQYKTRLDGTWSVTDIETVLSGLYNAIPATKPSGAQYRFVTDGRPGRLEALGTFLADIRTVQRPEALDETVSRNFGGLFTGTNRDYFDRLCSRLNDISHGARIVEPETLCHLLAHFSMVFGSAAEDQANAIQQRLRPYVGNLGDEVRVRQQLVGQLVERLASGEVRLDRAALDDLLRTAGVNPDRLRRYSALSRTLADLSRHRTSRRHDYRREADIRGDSSWPVDKLVSLLAGESGNGKSWRLCRTLEGCAERFQPAVFVSNTATAEAILMQASRDIWQTGLGETSEKSLQAISQFFHEIEPERTEPFVTVAVDDVQTLDLARTLISQDWRAWGMRLVMTVPASVARALAHADDKEVHIEPVSEFSVDELDALLQKHGQRWIDLPPDLKRLLRSPILAGLYVKLPYKSARKAPRSEYEIFDGFWQRIEEKGGHISDTGAILALATYVREGRPYPLPFQLRSQIGLTSDELLARLEVAGWLRCGENGEIAFAHDRLMNWAVARELFVKSRKGDFSARQLGSILIRSSDQPEERIFRRLGYVLMDVLWFLTRDETLTDYAADLVVFLEESREYGSYGEELYVHLLPTLGSQATGVLLKRLTVVAAADDDYRITLIGKSFSQLAAQEGFDRAKNLLDLLQSSSLPRQHVAIAALTVAPDVSALDRLWDIHSERADHMHVNMNNRTVHDYRATMAALRSGIECNPAWLKGQLLTSEIDQQHVSDLVYLLCGMEHSDAETIWRDTADRVMRAVPTNKPRSLLNAIGRFADRKRLEFVSAGLTRREDGANGAALATLAMLEPAKTIERLGDVSSDERYPTRGQWLPILLHKHGDQTRSRILTIAESEPKSHEVIENLFWERPNDLDRPMLQCVLRGIEGDPRAQGDFSSPKESDWLFHSLDFLGRITRPDLLVLLETEAGGALEATITAAACSRLSTNSNYHDHIRENARHCLLLMGGNGFTKLINRELASKHFWVRHGGLNWAFVRPDTETISLLTAIAFRPLGRDGNNKLESDSYREFYQATVALAAVGADEQLVSALWQAGVSEVPVSLARLRRHCGPLARHVIAQTRDILERAKPDQHDLLRALTIAWLSHDESLVPLLRALLQRTEDAEGKAAGLACIALEELGDRSNEFASLAYRVAQSSVNTRFGVSALANLGTVGAGWLDRWRRDRSGADSQLVSQVIRVLYENVDTRPLAIEAARDSLANRRFGLDTPYDIVAETGNLEIREQIYDKAFSSRSFVTTEPLRAIQGLVKLDLSRAVEAIEVALEHHPAIERELCQLLVTIAPDNAGHVLLRTALANNRPSLNVTAGRAMRNLDRSSVADLVVEAMAGSRLQRQIAISLAGWIPNQMVIDKLDGIAASEPVREVRLSAIEALERHKTLATVENLLGEFRRADAPRRWQLFAAILKGGDPDLLTKRDDPLWLGHVLTSELPDIFAHHALDVLRQRRQREK